MVTTGLGSGEGDGTGDESDCCSLQGWRGGSSRLEGVDEEKIEGNKCDDSEELGCIPGEETRADVSPLLSQLKVEGTPPEAC